MANVDNDLTDTEIKYYLAFIKEWLDPKLWKEKWLKGLKDSRTTRRIFFVLNSKGMKPVKRLLYLTALRYVDEFPEVLQQFAKRTKPDESLAVRFKEFQKIHEDAGNRKFDTKHGNYGGHGLMTPYYMNGHLTVKQFQAKINKASSVNNMWNKNEDIKAAVSAMLKGETANTPKAKNQLSWGSDPEFMLFDFEKGKVVSAIKVLKNDKHSPLDLGDGIKFYADNVLGEFSMPPTESIDEFIAMMTKVLHRGQKALGKRYRLIAKAAHIYDEEELDCPKALEGGCSPNFDVYANAANLPPKFKGGLRTGSFHIHLGADNLQTRAQKDNAIKYLDAYLGMASVVFDKDPTVPKRRELYGKAGEFRPTPYGIEYRVLGPYALRSPITVRLALELAALALKQAARSGPTENPMYPCTQKTVVRVINENLYDLANSNMGNGLSMDLCVRTRAPRSPDLYRDWLIPVE
jgi:hypothetical protein